MPWGFNEDSIGCLAMKEIAKIEIQNAIINYGITHFISGMAIGFDMIAAELVLELKKDYPFITLECAIPCKEQDKLWRQEQKERYKKTSQFFRCYSCVPKKYLVASGQSDLC